MARRRAFNRKGSGDSFDLAAPWQEGTRRRATRARGRRSGGSSVEVSATPLTIKLDEDAILQRVGEAMVMRFKDAVRTTRAKPKESTIRRRGPGDLFNVTGKFLREVTWKKGSKGDLFIVDPADRLGPGRRLYLFRRIREARHERILAWLRRTGRLDELLKAEIIETGFTRKGTGVVPGRLGGLIRRSR